MHRLHPGDDQIQVPGSNSMQGWHLLSRNLHQDCISNDSYGQTKRSDGAAPWASQARSSCTCLLSPPSSSVAVNGCCLLTPKKRIQAFETKCLGKLLRISFLTHKTNDWVRSKINFLLGHERGSGMSNATTASPKPPFRAPWGMGDVVVGRGNAEWTTSKSGHPCPC